MCHLIVSKKNKEFLMLNKNAKLLLAAVLVGSAIFIYLNAEKPIVDTVVKLGAVALGVVAVYYFMHRKKR